MVIFAHILVIQRHSRWHVIDSGSLVPTEATLLPDFFLDEALSAGVKETFIQQGGKPKFDALVSPRRVGTNYTSLLS